MNRNVTALAGIALVLVVRQLNGAAEPKAGEWKTWAMANGSAHRLQKPPGDEETQAELLALQEILGERDAGDVEAIEYWNSGSPAYRWIQIAQGEVQSHGLGGPAATRAMSLVAAGLNDAMVAAWDSKYTYRRARPSQVDPAIVTAVANPDTPSYPSEHLAAAGAASTVLAYLFPDREAALNAMVGADCEARLYAGTEFASDTTAGMSLGQAVGRAVVDHARNDGSD